LRGFCTSGRKKVGEQGRGVGVFLIALGGCGRRERKGMPCSSRFRETEKGSAVGLKKRPGKREKENKKKGSTMGKIVSPFALKQGREKGSNCWEKRHRGGGVFLLFLRSGGENVLPGGNRSRLGVPT